MRVLLILALVVASAASADPLRVVFVSGSFLYESDAVLAEYKTWLEEHYDVSVQIVSATDWDDLPGLEVLDDSDVALLYTRRLKIDGEQLQRIRDYANSGRPIVAVRTASHGFENWPEFDNDILGGDYQRHFPDGPTTRVAIVKPHPLLDGVEPFKSPSSLYRNPELAADCDVLLTGTTEDGTQPVAWIRNRDPGRVFYTSLGGKEDFAQEPFKRLIANALYWAASVESSSASGTSSSESR